MLKEKKYPDKSLIYKPPSYDTEKLIQHLERIVMQNARNHLIIGYDNIDLLEKELQLN